MIFTIADLHLPLGINKPMNIFGSQWDNYVERIRSNWQAIVTQDDTVIIPGDFSWATYIEQAEKDFEYLHSLNGRKIILKGNHDYWWMTMSKMNEFLEKNGFKRDPLWHHCDKDLDNYSISVQLGYANRIEYIKIAEKGKDNVIPSERTKLYLTHIKYVHQIQQALRLCGIEKEIEL